MNYAEIVRIVGMPTGSFCCIFTGKKEQCRDYRKCGKILGRLGHSLKRRWGAYSAVSPLTTKRGWLNPTYV